MSEHNMTILAQLVRHRCDHCADKPLLTFVDIDSQGNFIEETRSYRQLWDNGQRLAAWLSSQGMQPGDAFALVMQNHPEFVDFMVASSILGTVFVPIDPRTRGDKLRYMLDFAECRGAVVPGYAVAAVEDAWSGSSERWIATLCGTHGEHPGIRAELSRPLPDPQLPINSVAADAPMQLLYTSGTTGDPKAILSPHARLAVAASLPDLFGLDQSDCLYTGLSLTHANAQLVTLGMSLNAGIPCVISRKFSKSRLWDITRRYGCTFFNLLGGMTTAIYAEPPRDDDANNPVRKILSAGMPAAIWEDFSRRFGVELFEFYGAAEGGLTFNPTGIGPIGSCGKPPPNLQIAILDENGHPVAPGVAGEICFREADGSCPQVAYFKNQEATDKKLAGGWLHMGDIGHLDQDGWLFFHYRMGGGIRKHGDFINTAFVEKALSECDSVADAYVYGLAVTAGMAPGEKDIVGAVVPADRERFDVGAVFAACREKLDRNSVPDFIQVLDEIPKTASEKPQERFLVEAFENKRSDVYAADA
ncbi:ATP-dependent acyl-CoA ligase [Seongchinamella sediminis]|uniref:ATP-dependent acyl-CoA ligase n=1 Tax=Seongchinamella sediminis TaxID=2283635 RepID=A0A3L7DTZ7_9GAMM|nr:AMP-binding protein [Seongchinamella sediminis]RLQ21048.1 ATP-dependent acyl-CoA ligase [Seongchinamella sediminis]